MANQERHCNGTACFRCARLLNVTQESWFQDEAIDPQHPHRRSSALDDITMATFLDVAAIRCLFMPRWCEEGVHWALQFLFYRLVHYQHSQVYAPKTSKYALKNRLLHKKREKYSVISFQVISIN